MLNGVVQWMKRLYSFWGLYQHSGDRGSFRFFLSMFEGLYTSGGVLYVVVPYFGVVDF